MNNMERLLKMQVRGPLSWRFWLSRARMEPELSSFNKQSRGLLPSEEFEKYWFLGHIICVHISSYSLWLFIPFKLVFYENSVLLIVPNPSPFYRWAFKKVRHRSLLGPGQITASSFRTNSQGPIRKRVFSSPHLCEMKWNNQILLFRFSLVFFVCLPVFKDWAQGHFPFWKQEARFGFTALVLGTQK